MSSSSSFDHNNPTTNPDYDESTRLFSVGNSHLPKKQYRHAIESYTAALFLTPDDPTLSPYLYLARAESYNALGRHSSAADDARKAIGLSPSKASGYGMLGRTLFYLGDWRGCVIALEECAKLTKESGVGTMDVYDCAFLQKAQVELSREINSERNDDDRTTAVVVRSTAGGGDGGVVRVVPKLPPPRFVPRETAMGMSTSIPPMPSNWPTQSHSTTLRLGPDRIVAFGEGPMGIKLNRGSDGIIRVLSVQNTCIDPSSGVAIRPDRKGLMNPGDVVREAAGVDLRRPVTNIMWGDTVALIKMAKRPIELIVAKELSVPPKSVREELERELVVVRPSPGSTEEPVVLEEEGEEKEGNDAQIGIDAEMEEEEEEEDDNESDEELMHEDPPPLMDSADEPSEKADPSSLDDSLIMVESSDIPPPPISSPNPPQAPSITQTILFPPSLPYTTTSFNNPQSPPRLTYHSPIMKHTPTLFFPNNYTRLTLALYSHPPILLLLRPPSSTFEIKKLHPAHPSHPTIESYLIVDTCYILHTLKLQLSRLTTPTSPPSTHTTLPNDPRNPTVFLLLAPPPLENTVLSTMIRNDEDISDSSIVQLETSLWEQLLKKAICDVHGTTTRHDAIRGTVHSHIMSRCVDGGWMTELNRRRGGGGGGGSIVDRLDESGWSALHWACRSRYVEGVTALVVQCGANGGIMTPEGRNALHMASERLDAESLEILLSEGGMDPNVLDAVGQSPLTIVLLEGRNVGGARDVDLIRECAMVLRGWGGRVVRGAGSVDLVHDLAERWEGDVLGVSLEVRKWVYPLSVDMSNGGCFHYPMHAVMDGLKRRCEDGDDVRAGEFLVTLQILLRYGFEPNERCEGVPEHPHLDKWFGLTPLHLLGRVAKDMRVKYEELQVNYAENIDVVVKLHGLFDTISQAALLLCAHGARMALPIVCAPRPERRVPVKLRPDHGTSDAGDAGERDDNNEQSTGGRRGSNNSSSSSSNNNKTDNSDEELNLSDLFGSPTQLKDAQKKFAKFPPVEKYARQIIHAKEKKDSPFPGGSDEKSCFICWVQFGMIMQRRHRCRVTNHYVCEECSGKRVIVDGKEHRVSDGQYNLARLMTEAEELSKRQEQRLLHQQKKKSQPTKPAATTRAAAADAKDKKIEHDKDELFSGIRKSMEGLFKSEEMSEDEPSHAKKGAQMGELVNSLNQTRDALNERGEKLNSLSDKTDKLKNQASDFAQMAKELRESQEGGMFGFW